MSVSCQCWPGLKFRGYHESSSESILEPDCTQVNELDVLELTMVTLLTFGAAIHSLGTILSVFWMK